MPDLEEITGSIRSRLNEKERAREMALQSTRQIIKICRSAITKIQKREDPIGDISSAREVFASLKKEIGEYPDFLYSGYSMAAQQEIAEAEILASVVFEKELPSAEKLDISDEAFILGLGDAVGELRRIFLRQLMEDDIEEAKKTLKLMEEFFSALMTFEYPDAMVPSRRKQDVARGVVEKSRGELVLAIQMRRLRDELSR